MWQTTNAAQVSISGIGTVAASGSMSVSPSQTTSYTLTAKNELGTVAATATAVVTLRPLKVVFIGDSLLEGNWSGTGIQAAFPAFVAVNAGIGGNSDDMMLARFQTDVLDQNPDLVLIWGSGNGLGVTMTPAQVEQDWAKMVTLARDAHIGVVIATLSPQGPPQTTTGNPDIRALNAWLAGYASQNSVVLADDYPVLVDSNDELKSEYNADGVHLTVAGHDAVAPVFNTALARAAQQVGK
jgi:lysophospholipase L1-like esterase